MLDVGSNTAHLLVVDAHYGAAPMPAHSHKIELKLSERLGSESKIRSATVDGLCAFVEESVTMAEDLGVTEIMTFATSAVREAKNGDEVLAKVHERTGLEIAVLSGEDEARLTYLAARRWFGWSSGRILMLDIGGGSLEIAVGSDEDPDNAVSVPLGAGRLTSDFLEADTIDPAQLKEVRKHARATIADVAGSITKFGDYGMAVGSSKTFRQLARVAGAAPSGDGIYVPRELKRRSIKKWMPKLAQMTDAERAKIPGVSEHRARQLLAGAVVAEAAMDIFDIDTLSICPWALREGVILRRMDGIPE